MAIGKQSWAEVNCLSRGGKVRMIKAFVVLR